MSPALSSLCLLALFFLFAVSLYRKGMTKPLFGFLWPAEIPLLFLVAGLFIIGAVAPVGLLALSVLALLGRLSLMGRGARRDLARLLLAVLALLMALHLLPGFARYPLISGLDLSTASTSWNLLLSVDKALVGAVLVTYLLLASRYRSLSRSTLLLATLAPLSIIALALLLGLPLDAKAGSYLLWFLPVNLLATVIAEELFFRKLVQDELSRRLPKTVLGSLLSVLIVSGLFLLAHGILLPSGAAGWLYAAAAVFYAGIYQFSRRVELSILAHWALNIWHIFLLPYPLHP